MADRSWLVSLRASAIVPYPTAASLRTMLKPRPRLPPVTRTLRIATCDFPSGRNGQGGNEIDTCRHFVPRQRYPTKAKDFFFELLAVSGRGTGICVKYDVSYYKRTRN